jgi:hypothetical protein
MTSDSESDINNSSDPADASTHGFAHLWLKGWEEDSPSEQTRERIRRKIKKARDKGHPSFLLFTTTQYEWKYYNPMWPRPHIPAHKTLVKFIKDQGLSVTYHTRTVNGDIVLDVHAVRPPPPKLKLCPNE